LPTEESQQETSSHQKRLFYAFDEAARGLAAGTISRRQALKLSGTALLGGGLLAMFPGVADAQSDPGCRSGPVIDNRRCPDNACGGNNNCGCAETVSGARRCVNFQNSQCPDRDECDRNSDCPQGQVCIRVGGCCTRHPRRNDCRPLCR
jgi:hypothetical protein